MNFKLNYSILNFKYETIFYIYKKVVYSKSIYGEDGNWLGMVMDEKSIACDAGKNGNRFSETILRIDSLYRDSFPKIPSPSSQ